MKCKEPPRAIVCFYEGFNKALKTINEIVAGVAGGMPYPGVFRDFTRQYNSFFYEQCGGLFF
jgi:hypothetical protein